VGARALVARLVAREAGRSGEHARTFAPAGSESQPALDHGVAVAGRSLVKGSPDQHKRDSSAHVRGGLEQRYGSLLGGKIADMEDGRLSGQAAEQRGVERLSAAGRGVTISRRSAGAGRGAGTPSGSPLGTPRPSSLESHVEPSSRK